jgi:hypothetical protein
MVLKKRLRDQDEIALAVVALNASPETVGPSEYHAQALAAEMSETCNFASLDEGNGILGL